MRNKTERIETQFYAHLQGSSEGCDYTIGCGLAFEELKSKNWDEAVKEVEQRFKDYGGDERVESITLLHVRRSVVFTSEELSENIIRVLHLKVGDRQLCGSLDVNYTITPSAVTCKECLNTMAIIRGD